MQDMHPVQLCKQTEMVFHSSDFAGSLTFQLLTYKEKTKSWGDS